MGVCACVHVCVSLIRRNGKPREKPKVSFICRIYLTDRNIGTNSAVYKVAHRKENSITAAHLFWCGVCIAAKHRRRNAGWRTHISCACLFGKLQRKIQIKFSEAFHYFHRLPVFSVCVHWFTFRSLAVVPPLPFLMHMYYDIMATAKSNFSVVSSPIHILFLDGIVLGLRRLFVLIFLLHKRRRRKENSIYKLQHPFAYRIARLASYTTWHAVHAWIIESFYSIFFLLPFLFLDWK